MFTEPVSKSEKENRLSDVMHTIQPIKVIVKILFLSTYQRLILFIAHKFLNFGGVAYLDFNHPSFPVRI